MESGQKHPLGMYTLSITALFQNFGFWGVVSFFPLYLTGEYQYSEADATEAYGVFLGIATALPLLVSLTSALFQSLDAGGLDDDLTGGVTGGTGV